MLTIEAYEQELSKRAGIGDYIRVSIRTNSNSLVFQVVRPISDQIATDRVDPIERDIRAQADKAAEVLRPLMGGKGMKVRPDALVFISGSGPRDLKFTYDTGLYHAVVRREEDASAIDPHQVQDVLKKSGLFRQVFVVI